MAPVDLELRPTTRSSMNGGSGVNNSRASAEYLPTHDDERSAAMSIGNTTDDEENISSTQSARPYAEVREIAQEETKRINFFRLLVIVIILAVGAGISVFVFKILNDQMEQDTQDALNLFASTIEENWKFRVATIFSANRALGRSITTSESRSSAGNRFPFFSVPAWEAKAYEARIQAGFEAVMYAPVIASRDRWVNFTQETRDWLDESKEIFDQLEPGKDRSSEPPTPPLPDVVWDFTGNDQEWELEERTFDRLMVPTLHLSPPPLQSVEIYQNINMFSNEDYKAASAACIVLKDAVFTGFSDVLVGLVDNLIGEGEHQAAHLTDRKLYPHSIAAQPVYRGLGQDTDDVVGYIYSVVAWDRYLLGLLPDGVVGINVVLRNSCGQAVTFELVGSQATVIADSDVTVGSPVVSLDFAENYFDPSLTTKVEGHCQVFLDVYSSAEFEESYQTFLPIGMTLMVSSLFFVMAVSFGLYDWFVQNRNEKVVGVAERSNAIVSGLFPKNVKERLMEEQLDKQREHEKQQRKNSGLDPKNLLSFLSDRDLLGGSSTRNSITSISKSTPIADFYPETTILFADLAGFTAWSSVREPPDVFVLLETIYHEFDQLAKRRKVFKVETIGDCYIAVAGLPTPRKDHAVAICRFAKECMYATWKLTTELARTLGPDTDNLTMRMGIHSGPVTAGVLRGDKGRFSLFGDTMNTASRMESNGTKSRIQISQETADQLHKLGKDRWFQPREDKIKAKGKGELQTYWLNLSAGSETATLSSGEHSESGGVDFGESERNVQKVTEYRTAAFEQKLSRLVIWNVEMLSNQLKRIIAYRNAGQSGDKNLLAVVEEEDPAAAESAPDENSGIFPLPGEYDNRSGEMVDPKSIELDPKVVLQLTSYVGKIASMYNNHNPFHNFEHSSHMTMTVVKLLSRMAAPKKEEETVSPMKIASELSDKTYGITSDPLMQFAVLFASLIHDVDHPGVPNMRLVEEHSELAQKYSGRSVAEQNSFNVAWDALLSDEYTDLRATIYTTEAEKQRLRTLVETFVIATDMTDHSLKAKRDARWDEAFKNPSPKKDSEKSRDKKATIVMEYMMQACDIAHTMQHWHVFRTWNEKLFREMNDAYKEGRADEDPSDSWYDDEAGFFTYCVIPLAKKLKECGVFGTSGEIFVKNAEQNLAEWEEKGQEVVNEMKSKLQGDSVIAPMDARESFLRRHSMQNMLSPSEFLTLSSLAA